MSLEYANMNQASRQDVYPFKSNLKTDFNNYSANDNDSKNICLFHLVVILCDVLLFNGIINPQL